MLESVYMGKRSPEAPAPTLAPEQRSYWELEKPEKLFVIQLQSSMTAAEVYKKFEWAPVIITTDFPVTASSTKPVDICDDEGVLLGLYFPGERVISIDHHINRPEMNRHVSSTNLMIRFVQLVNNRNSPARQALLEMLQMENIALDELPVVVNHTDLDSVFASAIAKGLVAPIEETFGRRAIYADHTGEADELTDLLMAVDPERDYDLSLQVLQRWLVQMGQTYQVQKLYQERLQQREMAQNIAQEMHHLGEGVYYTQLTGRLRFSGDLMVPGQPEATVLVLAQPINPRPKGGRPVDPRNYEIKIRAGLQFPEGASLLEAVRDFPPEWNVRGRYNALNTTRGGGFPAVHPKTGVATDPILVAKKIQEYLQQRK